MNIEDEVENYDVDIKAMSSNDATIVRINLWENDFDSVVVSATGIAKRDPIDKHDPEIGMNLALGRAFSAIGRKLEKRANGLVTHNDNLRIKKSSSLLLKKLLEPSNDVLSPKRKRV